MKKNKNLLKDWAFVFLGVGFLVIGFLIHKNSLGRDQMTTQATARRWRYCPNLRDKHIDVETKLDEFD